MSKIANNNKCMLVVSLRNSIEGEFMALNKQKEGKNRPGGF
ncbi:MAG TPA: hypothetical protein VK553_00670 [Candidatus Nitrosopolaris rasttigaisensis]|nr:hypothetical protein [Candidatus Nitrosopolaris rasttigaisensis]